MCSSTPKLSWHETKEGHPVMFKYKLGFGYFYFGKHKVSKRCGKIKISSVIYFFSQRMFFKRT